MDLNKIIFLMMLCVPMFVGAQTLTFTDYEPMGNMRTQVTRQAGPSGEAQVALIRKAYKTIPELTEELHHAGIHPVLVATGYPVGFYSREPMADLSALKEQTWRTASFWHISYLENAGATNKRIPWGEQVSDSLRSGQRMGHRCPPCRPSPVGVAGTLVRAHLFSGDEPRPMECPAPEGQASHRACGKQDLQGDGQDDG